MAVLWSLTRSQPPASHSERMKTVAMSASLSGPLKEMRLLSWVELEEVITRYLLLVNEAAAPPAKTCVTPLLKSAWAVALRKAPLWQQSIITITVPGILRSISSSCRAVTREPSCNSSHALPRSKPPWQLM